MKKEAELKIVDKIDLIILENEYGFQKESVKTIVGNIECYVLKDKSKENKVICRCNTLNRTMYFSNVNSNTILIHELTKANLLEKVK